MSRAERVALDTEFHAERRYLPKLYLVQLRLDDGSTWLVDPERSGHIEALAEPLRTTTWVVHGGLQDMRILRDALGALPETVFDTQVAAALVDEAYPAPFAGLLDTWLGVRIQKLATLSDWSRRPLEARQLGYAAEDVRLLLDLWDRLAAEAHALGRTALVRAACAEARARVVDPPPADLAWRDIRAARVLDPHEAAILQELCAWREQTARALDQPSRFVLADGLLTELSRRRPLTLESLAANRRVSRSLVKKHGEEILDRIRRASQRPEWAWPQPVKANSPAARRTSWLRTWAAASGHANRWAPDFALPRRLAEDLASEPPASRAVLANQLGAWRNTLLGDALWDAVQGRAGLRIDGDVQIIPLPRD